MRVLVTGAGGFIGRHLVGHLTAEGHEVTGVDVTGAVPVDFTDEQQMLDAVRAGSPDVVVHLGAISNVGDSWRSPTEAIRVNVLGTASVLSACVRESVGRVLVVGSAEEYGRVAAADMPLDEDTPLRPMTPYGASKAAAGMLAIQAFLGEGLATIRVRCFSVIGPGQSSAFFVPGLASRIVDAERRGDHGVEVGNLTAIRDMLDVRDAVRGFSRLLTEGEPGEVYNLCSGTGVVMSDVAAALVAGATMSIELRDADHLHRPIETPRLVGDPSRMQAITGWTPTVPLRTTISDVLDLARSSSTGGVARNR